MGGTAVSGAAGGRVAVGGGLGAAVGTVMEVGSGGDAAGAGAQPAARISSPATKTQRICELILPSLNTHRLSCSHKSCIHYTIFQPAATPCGCAVFGRRPKKCEFFLILLLFLSKSCYDDTQVEERHFRFLKTASPPDKV
jgi:hypothetical protein